MTRLQRWLVRLAYWGFMGFVALTIHDSFSFLLLNTLLAYIPIELSFWLTSRRSTIFFWLLAVIWLLFYPNAPYLLTDLFHLSLLKPYAVNGLLKFDLGMWRDFAYLVTPTVVSIILGTYSVDQIAQEIQRRLHLTKLFAGRTLISMVLFLFASIGVYVGRFLRLHTIYLLITPQYILEQLAEMWSSKMLAFVLIIWALQLVIYGAWRFTTTLNPSQNSNSES
ncbi:DUF1361 domain-containing protein [Lactiplantibacillus sp. WILCCON 0030]|uniref:DUF1361 domain-containing protein n=1 Tax=Lactiplantibacillus brownii TaxID=3069269 RepID=A0ABU1A882_9LACO|nr:DUF1361 domain-containing protein [Lactiplantibacillus brownii]MDQ7936648.1 DUF1361 domain-containing protein [Lactiplantibacillus brownii]